MIGRTVILCYVIISSALFSSESLPKEQSRISECIGKRSFPSIFQAWNGCGSFPESVNNSYLPKHNLIFNCPEFYGLQWNNSHSGLGTGFKERSIVNALATRTRLLRANPCLIMLAEIRYYDGPRNFLPPGHAWWLRSEGKRLEGWQEGGFYRLDFANPEFRRHVATQAAAVMATGCFDGIMLDWWNDDRDHLLIIKEVRDAIGTNALILVNSNERQIPVTAPYVNGLFMECRQPKTFDDWKKVTTTLEWAERSVRKPTINCLETWWQKGRSDLRLMRLTTTLSTVLSNGYCLFSDPNQLPTPDHRHVWYSFWNTDLGRPLEVHQSLSNGLITRRFTKGVAVCNPVGNSPEKLTLDKKYRSLATGRTSHTFSINSGDGDFLIKP